MDLQFNAVGWFEIPVTNMERAMAFYTNVFGYELQRVKMESIDMAWFPWIDNGMGASGSLCLHEEWYKPTTDGVLIYFNSPTGDLNNELAKIADAGGQVIMEKTLISDDLGYFGLFIDTEGNRVALHSRA